MLQTRVEETGEMQAEKEGEEEEEEEQRRRGGRRRRREEERAPKGAVCRIVSDSKADGTDHSDMKDNPMKNLMNE